MAMKQGFSFQRRIADAAEGLGTAGAILALVVALVYASTRPAARIRWDLTDGHQYGLTAQTKKVLAGLENELEIITLLRPEPSPLPTGLGAVQVKAIDYVHSLLDEYVLASGGKVRVVKLDPHADRLATQALVNELHLSRYNVVIVRQKNRAEQLFLEELVMIDEGMLDADKILPAQLVDVRGEGPLTSALLRVTQAEQPKMGLVVGYGGPQATDFDVHGLAIFIEDLRLQGIETVNLDLSMGSGVPEDLSLVALIGPSVPLSDRAALALWDYQQQGGSLLLAVDPEFPSKSGGAYDDLLRNLGVSRDRQILASDGGLGEGIQRGSLTITEFGEHEVTSAMKRQRLFARFPLTGSLRRYETAAPGVVLSPLAWTAGEVWGDQPTGSTGLGDFTFNEGEGEQRGSRWVALARGENAGDGRVIALGCARLLTNYYMGQGGGPANAEIGRSVVHFLAGRDDVIELGPRPIYQSRVELLEGERERVFKYVGLVMPFGGLLLGFLVWLRRRQ